MKPKLYIILAVIFIILAAPRCFAADTTMVYANQLNHYYIFGGWNHFATRYNKLYVSSRIANNSSIYSETSRLKTQTNVNLDVLYALSPTFRAGLTGKYFLFQDGQTYHAYDYNQGRAGIKGDYKKQHYTIMLESGYARETRLGIRDMGWYGGMELNRNISGLLFYPELNWDYSQMGNRRNYTFDNRIYFRVKTSSLLKNTFSAGFKAYNREYYITREADTEERLNTTVYIGNDLYYPVNKNLIVDYKVKFSSTQDGLNFSYYDTKETRTRQFLSLQNDVRLRGHIGAFRGYVGLTNDYRQSRTTATNPAISLPSDYIFDKKNILARISWKLTENDSLYINYRGSLLYYDTPDTNNYDDRDELSYSVSPAWHHRIDEYTSLSISGNMFLHHYVYLFHQRSAQNHWNRVYSLKSEINTNIPRIIRWNAKQEIYANYFVYDYEDSAFVHVQSMVFRGLKLQQSIQYYFTPKWIIRGYMFFRWEDNGLLDWEDFIQELTDSKYTIKIELTPGYKTKHFTIAAGPVYSHRRDFRYQDMVNYTESYHSIRIGGVLLLQYSNKITLSYRLEQIDQTGISRVYNQSGSLRFNWIF
ncbi:MAG: hypothetical protein KAT14_08675 [Candidatus Marinimicrobia bacterium]|nr:hypothetical protein [Candidatus Neomarinimicrobiota bacterium]